MTESGVTEIGSVFEDRRVEELTDVNSNSAADLEVVDVIAYNNGKNEIKVSEEGIAKLAFGFLDDMQGGDSSLEPGEVKTPPPGSSPANVKETIPRLVLEKQLPKEPLVKALKTVSQMEAEACEEKVRAILELDAKLRKEEMEKKKMEAEKRRQSGETETELKRKRKAKEERKKLKILKKAKKAVEKALGSCEEVSDKEVKKKVHIKKKRTGSEESEGLCSSGVDDDDEDKVCSSDKHSNLLNSVIAIPTMQPPRYPPHLPPAHILPEAFIGSYRPMTTFMRGPRPDFIHGRGGFIPRGRGGMRGRMQFQGFRPPFFTSVANIGIGPGSSGPVKFNVPHGSHGLQQQQQRQQYTPPPNRGHSPILPPTSDLQWTKTKPSISYAFKFQKDHKSQSVHSELKSQYINKDGSKEDWDNEKTYGVHDGKPREENLNEEIRKKDKEHKSLLKERKNLKGHRNKDSKKSKKRRSLQSLLSSSISTKEKKSSKSSRRQIEKIRKSYGSTTRKAPSLQKQQSLKDTETAKENPNENVREDKFEAVVDDILEKIPNEEEIRNKVENIKKEKVETTELKIEDLTLKVKPLIIVKKEPEENEKEVQKEKEKKREEEKEKDDKKEENQDKIKYENSQVFDIFADTPPSPPPSHCDKMKKTVPEEKSSEVGVAMPPLLVMNNPKVQKSSLQNALEIQRRIDKLLQQDDIKFEAIEAAKDLLIKKTQKYQSSKESALPERNTNKADEQKTSKCSKSNTSPKETILTSKEKPMAYKDKDLSKKSKESEKDKDRGKSKDSSKDKIDKESKHKENSSSSKNELKDEKKSNDYDKNKRRSSEKDKTQKKFSNYHNPFKRSISRDRFFGKIDSRKRAQSKSRERDYSTKHRLSNDRKCADSFGYSSSRLSLKRRISGSSSASTTLHRSKSGDQDIKGSLDSLCSKEKDLKDKRTDKTPESRQTSKRPSSPKRKIEKEKDSISKSKPYNKAREIDLKSNTPPPKSIKKDDNTLNKQKETKKSKSPIKSVPKKRPLSFTQTEFLFPEDGNEDDFIMPDDEETNDSFKNLKSRNETEDSPDTDDYMDNWENDEDVDLDTNSNIPTYMSTPRKSSIDLTEDDSFVIRFANPSPPPELLKKHIELNTEHDDYNDASLPHTPPIDLLKKTQINCEDKNMTEPKNCLENVEIYETKKTELFGMQELYDQFIKSVEASGVSMQTSNKEEVKNTDNSLPQGEVLKDDVDTEIQNQSDDPLSTSSASTSSSTSSSSSSSSDSNSSSNSSTSSSSSSSSEDSNDDDEFERSVKKPTKKIKLEEAAVITNFSIADKIPNTVNDIGIKTDVSNNVETTERVPEIPSSTPLQKTLLLNQTSITPTPQNKATPKSDVAKDFKKLKNLEANLSRIQMMRANYDSNDEISEELHKMEILFLQEKKLILQKYAKNTQPVGKPIANVNATTEFVPELPSNDFSILPPPPPPEEPNKIFDVNREAIKLTISPVKLPSKPAIFNVSLTEETEKKTSDDKDEMDFTEKLVKPAKEVAIVKPMMETKESKESRSRDSHRHRRSPVYGSRDRQRSPSNYRDRNRRSTSRSRFSPQRRGRGRSLSISPPRRGISMRHGTPPRRVGAGGRFRVSNRRSRSRSRSPLRQFGNRRGKEGSPFRSRKRGQLPDSQTHYKKFSRHRNSRSHSRSRSRSRSRSPRSPQTRPRSPRTPPPRRRSYSQDPYSRSPLPFKPPSPPMRRSLSPTNSTSSQSRRSRSTSPRRPRSPHSPRSPRSPLSPRSPHSPRSSRSPNRYNDHRYRRGNSFERHSSISPHPQYYAAESLSSSVSPQTSSYYYNVSPNRISLDARINIVLNTPSGGRDTPPSGYEGYANYAQYGGAAYMSLPPQPMSDPLNNIGYYQNPYVPVMPQQDAQHTLQPPNTHPMHTSHSHLPPHLEHPPAYSNIPTINSGILGHTSSSLPPNNFYFNDFNMGQQQPINPVLKELPKASAPVAVQKGNVLEIVPSTVESTQSPQSSKIKTSPSQTEAIKTQNNKISAISWKDEVNNRHLKSAVMRLSREGNGEMRSILKRSESIEKPEKPEKKKVYFEDGIYPSRDSDDEDRKLIEMKIRRKVLRLRKKCGIDVSAARDLLGEKFRVKLQKPKIDPALEKLPPPPPPTTLPPANIEQPIYLKPPTPVPLVYFHFDSVVHSMYVSQLEKPIPPRLLNPKCVPPGAVATVGSGNGGVGSGSGLGVAGGSGNTTNNPATQSPNHNLSCSTSIISSTTTKKELTALAALNRVGRNENLMNSPKMPGDSKRESPKLQQSVTNKSCINFAPTQTSPQMSPLHGSVIRHPPSPIGFVGMRVNNFMRLPPSPLSRATVPSHMQNPPPVMANLPPGHHQMMGMRHPQYNMPPPNLIPPDSNYSSVGGNGGGSPYGAIQAAPPGFHGYGHRPMNPGFFMSAPPSHTMHPPPPMSSNCHIKDKELVHHHKNQHLHHHHHHPHPHPHVHAQQQQQQQHKPHKPPPPLPPPVGNNVVAASPQAMIAPFNIKKTVN